MYTTLKLLVLSVVITYYVCVCEDDSDHGDGAKGWQRNALDGYLDNEFSLKKHAKNAQKITVSLQRRKIHWCTGVAISLFWVLSAAEPFYTLREVRREITARIGTVNCDRGGQQVPIKLFVIHPYYKYGQPEYDLSLLKVSRALKQKFAKPIPFSPKSSIQPMNAALSFWNREEHIDFFSETRNRHPDLMVAHVYIEPKVVCQDRLKSAAVAFTNLLCLVGETNNTASVGAPLYDSSGLLGIVSAWSTPSKTVFVAYRMRDPDVMTWIKDVFKTFRPNLKHLRWKIDSRKW